MTGTRDSDIHFQIRRAISSDAPHLIRVLSTSIKEICSKDYTADEIEAWAGRKHSLRSWEDLIARDYVWVVIVSGNIEGFCHFAVMDEVYGELMGLYLSGAAGGNGIGRNLLQKVLDISQCESLSRIDLISTRSAKNFYSRLGFHSTGNEIYLTFQDQRIQAFPMELWL